MATITRMAIQNTPEFWQRVKASTNSNSIGVFSDDGLLYVAANDTIKMVPFIRNREELFETTIAREYTSKKFRIIINGQFYGLDNSGKADAFIGHDPVDPGSTTPEGIVILNKARIGGRAAPMMFYIANRVKEKKRYIFGYGNTPTNVTSGVGGCGPIIIGNLPYGVQNKFKSGVAGILTGMPTPKNRPFLIQRSNSTFSAFTRRPPYTGKTIIAYNDFHKVLFVIVQPDAAHGISIEEVRDKLISIGTNNAVFLDGSDSSLLVVDGKFLAHAGENKDETNTVGIGFTYK